MDIYSRDIYEVEQNGNLVKVCAPCYYAGCQPAEDLENRKACVTRFIDAEGNKLGRCACLGDHDISSHERVMKKLGIYGNH